MILLLYIFHEPIVAPSLTVKFSVYKFFASIIGTPFTSLNIAISTPELLRTRVLSAVNTILRLEISIPVFNNSLANAPNFLIDTFLIYPVPPIPPKAVTLKVGTDEIFRTLKIWDIVCQLFNSLARNVF